MVKNKEKSLEDLKRFIFFLSKFELKISHVFIPLIFNVLGAFLEGAGIGLMAPLLRGLLENENYSLKNFYFKNLIEKIIFYVASVLNINFNDGFFLACAFSVAALLVLSQFCKFISAYFFSKKTREFIFRLRNEIYKRYLNFGSVFYDQQNSGRLYYVLIACPNNIAYALEKLRVVFYYIFILFINISVMFYLSWKLSIFLFFIFPILYSPLKKILKNIGLSSEKITNEYNNISENISNILSCIPLVKSYSNEKNELRKFTESNEKIKNFEISLDKSEIAIPPIQETVSAIFILIFISVSYLFLIKPQELNLLNFIVYVVFLRRSISYFGSLNLLWSVVASVKGSLNEILNVFNNEKKFILKEKIRSIDSFQYEIAIKNLNFTYPKSNQHVLKNINLKFSKGAFVALVGPSGSGKSTLINLLMKFYEAPKETIFIDGIDINELSATTIREKIAYVSQQPLLFNASVYDNLTYALNRKITEEEIYEALEQAKLLEKIISQPDKLLTNIGEKGLKLSGGEKQRLSIARAILKKSEIIILDEATSSLDSRTEKFIQESIQVALKGKTAIVIAHRLSTIKMADLIVVINDGVIAEQGNFSDLIRRNSIFYGLWENQII